MSAGRNLLSIAIVLAWSLVCAGPCLGEPQVMRFYLGTYTNRSSQGIYLGEVELASGRMGELRLVARATNPSYLDVSTDGRFLYCVNELPASDGKKTGAVSAFAIDPAQQLTLINQQSSQGASPCFITVDPQSSSVLVANYSSGTVALLPIQPDGSLTASASFHQHQGHGPSPRQKSPHAHSIRLDPTGRYAVAADLGTDRLVIYRIEGQRLVAHGLASVEAGAGPRHLAFSPDGRYVYVINELKSLLSVFAWDAQSGTLTAREQIATIPADFSSPNYGAEVQVHPNGRFVYCSNRGHNSITIFAVDANTGMLSLVGHESTRGEHPRHFALTPAGELLMVANKDSDNLVIFRVDSETGRLSHLHTATAPTPVCIRFAP